ncbi:hypothetical protein NQ317_014854 [Molorchus minor]|uniref:G-protein coupled receptors family 1 profile domain-containing protein n=1 Tax=Molorchus minor TaxID=1323400 RepID=A0ABQ9JSZ0_9CUCU|nr:hypothetical protein NQ317_014854 [Molorchus minor]
MYQTARDVAHKRDLYYEHFRPSFNDDMEIVFSLESLAQAGIIFIMALAIIITNVLIIATLINFRGPSEVINCYLLSLAVADLLCGVLVVPFRCTAPAVKRDWAYREAICRIVGYLEVTLWAVTSVHLHVDQRRPLSRRRETSDARDPPNKNSVPMLDGLHVDFRCHVVLSAAVGEYATALSENLSNPSHKMSFALVVAFWLSWLPFICIKLYEYFTNYKFQIQFLHFGIVWLGFLNSFWKSMILMTLSPQFRLALRIFCMTICCRYKGRMQAELIGMEADD